MGYYETLAEWYELSESIKVMQERERALREGLFKGSFPDAEEGTNTLELPDGRGTLKGVKKINRKVIQDEAAALPTKLRNHIFKTKLELKTTEYRGLDEDTRLEVDRVLVLSEGLPSLTFIPPKPVTP